MIRQDANNNTWRVAKFRDVATGATFQQDGNTWRKRSTRTADLIGPDGRARPGGGPLGRTWAHFTAGEVVEVQA